MSEVIPSIDVATAAEILHVSTKTIGRWIESGKLRALRVGGRLRTTMEWIQATVEPVSGPPKTTAKGVQNSDCKNSRARIAARWGI